MSVLEQLTRLPGASVEFANILLTQDDARTGTTPKDIVWTHRKTTLYRYRSAQREHAIPVLLVFALINRPDIFDLRAGSSFVEFLLDEGFDVFLLDWGVPGDEDADMGLDSFVCDELHWGIRETLRAAEQDELTLLGWCIGGTLCAMYAALHADGPVRNLALLTDRHRRLALHHLGGPRELRRRAGHRRLPVGAGRHDQHGQQADEAGHQLVLDLPPAVGRRAGGPATTGGPPGHGALGGGQPAVSRPRLPGVDHLDVQGEPARRRPPATPPRARRPAPHRAEPPGRHRGRRPHRPAARHRPHLRPGLQC